MADKKSPSSSLHYTVQQDSERGRLEIWPANGGAGKNNATVPKPQFLQHLESYLERELRILGCPAEGPNELRLQAHREVFERLIEDFKTYKPLMSAIKREYDLFILHQNDIIRELLPLQTRLEAIRDDNERKLRDVKEREKKQDDAVRTECERLKLEMEQMKIQELNYTAQIEKLQEEIGILYEKYRNEADARKLLVTDYNEMRARQNEQLQEEGETVEREDPVILKLQLIRAKEDLRSCHMRVNTMLADYGDVVPRGEFEMLDTAYKTMESDVEVLKGQYSTLMDEHDTLLVMYKDIQVQRDHMLNELTRMKGSATPRPDWSRCGEFIEGGMEKWVDISEGRTSDELVDVLLSQIAGLDINDIARHEVFQGQGISAHIPMYLRHEGQVSNRRMGRSELEDIIRGFWEYRTTRIAEGRGDSRGYPIDTLLYEYLLARNDGNEEMAIEDGYNLQNACTRYSHECHIGIFYSILQGEVMEEVYDGWISTQVNLMEHLSKTDTGHKKYLSQQQMYQLLKALFPSKNDGDIDALVQSASGDDDGNIDYIKLMQKGRNGAPSKFVTLVLEQRRTETEQYVRAVSAAIGDKSTVAVGQLIKVLKTVDPNKPSSEVQLLVSRLYNTPLGQTDNNATIATDKLIKYLSSSNIGRSG